MSFQSYSQTFNLYVTDKLEGWVTLTCNQTSPTNVSVQISGTTVNSPGELINLDMPQPGSEKSKPVEFTKSSPSLTGTLTIKRESKTNRIWIILNDPVINWPPQATLSAGANIQSGGGQFIIASWLAD